MRDPARPGDLAQLAKQLRRILEDAGLHRVRIFASSSRTEDEISDAERPRRGERRYFLSPTLNDRFDIRSTEVSALPAVSRDCRLGIKGATRRSADCELDMRRKTGCREIRWPSSRF